MIRWFSVLCALLCLPLAAHAAEYKIDPAQSRIVFSGTHADNPFSGMFKNWSAHIVFDPKHLETSLLDITIETGSAKTGNVLYDGTLPTQDWFDVKTYPTAKFISREIKKNADGTYVAIGALTLRDHTVPISFSFALTPPDLSVPQVKSQFSLTLDRLAFGVGEKSDQKAEWVGRHIKIDVTVQATRV